MVGPDVDPHVLLRGAARHTRGDADFANRVLSAMRKQFGGHDEKKKVGT